MSGNRGFSGGNGSVVMPIGLTAASTVCAAIVAAILSVPITSAGAEAGAESRAKTATLLVAIPLDNPPYVMENGSRGFEPDLVRRALRGYQVRFVQKPYRELEIALRKRQVDVALPIQITEKGLFYSNGVVTFRNFAITKRADALKIDSVADLENHPVLTWQDAYLELGEEFKGLFSPKAPQRRNYIEFADQREQVRQFWKGKDQVIVIDRNIFNYFTKDLGYSPGKATFHSIFPRITSFRVGFKDAAVRDEFARRLAKLRKSGEYAELFKCYHISGDRNIRDPGAVHNSSQSPQ
jgi:polar amino acid transport system substrate-binding protein